MKHAGVLLVALAAALIVAGVMMQLVLAGLDVDAMQISERVVYLDANAWADRLLLLGGVSGLLAIAVAGVKHEVRTARQL